MGSPWGSYGGPDGVLMGGSLWGSLWGSYGVSYGVLTGFFMGSLWGGPYGVPMDFFWGFLWGPYGFLMGSYGILTPHFLSPPPDRLSQCWGAVGLPREAPPGPSCSSCHRPLHLSLLSPLEWDQFGVREAAVAG